MRNLMSKFEYKCHSLYLRFRNFALMRNSGFKEIFIDITGACNAHCPYCVKGSGSQRQGGFMSVSTFDKVLKYLKLNNALTTTIHLFNWGEPSLHPEINEILRTVGRYECRAFLSTNMMHLPDYSRRSLSFVNGIDISLSGFSQASYGRIHGGQLDKVLQNIDDLLKMVENAGCPWKPAIRWHRYRFNEAEKDAAAKYFKSRGIKFNAIPAHLNDMTRIMDLIDNKLEPLENRQIEKDLFIDYWKEVYRRTNNSCSCPIWPWLVIDENADASLCCGISNEVKDNNLGQIFNISLKDLIKIKSSSPLCKRCLESGLANSNSAAEGFTLDDFLDKKGRIDA